MSDRIGAVQGLRAVAALLVVFAHAAVFPGELAGYRHDFHDGFVYLGRLGVRVFFVVSGFIMIHSAADSFGRPGATWEFLRRRFARIVPLYWLVTAVVALRASVKGDVPTAGELASSLLFIPYWKEAANDVRPLHGVGWSLNYEMLFYVLFAAVLLQPLRRGVALLCGALVALTLIGFALPPVHKHDAVGVLVRSWTNSILLYFLAGVLIGLLRRRLQRRGRLPLPIEGHAALGASLALALAGAWYSDGHPKSEAAIALVAPTTVLLCAFARFAASPAASTRTMLRLGDASYSIYLLHPFVVVLVFRVWSRLGTPGGPVALVAFSCVLSSLLAVLSYRWIERPSLRLLLPVSDRGRRVSAVGEARSGLRQRLKLRSD